MAVNQGLWAGHVGGIEVSVQLSSLLTAVLAFASLGLSFRDSSAEGNPTLAWGAAAAGVLLLGLSFVLHSAAQVMVAHSRDLPVRSLTFLTPGGVLETHKELWDHASDLHMATAGLATHLLVGISFLTSAWALGWIPSAPGSSTAVGLLVAVGSINLGLFALHLVPSFPMDGGRLLRALLSRRGGGVGRATRLGAWLGQALAMGLIVGGLIRLLQGRGFSATLVLVGWLLHRAVDAGYTVLPGRLRGLRVADVMRRSARVDGRTSVSDLVDSSAEHLLAHSGFHVVSPTDSVTGLVTAREIRNLHRGLWTATRVEKAMLPVEQLPTIEAGSSLAAALDVLGPYDVQHLPVIEGGQLVGTISRDAILELTAPQVARQAERSSEATSIVGRPRPATADQPVPSPPQPLLASPSVQASRPRRPAEAGLAPARPSPSRG